MILISEVGASGTRRSGAMNNQVAHRRNQAQHGWHLAGTEGPRAWHERAPRQGGPTAGARGCQYASSLAQGWPGERYSGSAAESCCGIPECSVPAAAAGPVISAGRPAEIKKRAESREGNPQDPARVLPRLLFQKE